MDRSSEFGKALLLCDASPTALLKHEALPSPFRDLLLQMYLSISLSNSLVDQMLVLSDKQEFSNDPLTHVSKLSKEFERAMTLLRSKLAYWKSNKVTFTCSFKKAQTVLQIPIDAPMQSQSLDHQQLVMESITNGIELSSKEFHNNMLIYSKNKEEKRKRITKYGTVSQERNVSTSDFLTTMQHQRSKVSTELKMKVKIAPKHNLSAHTSQQQQKHTGYDDISTPGKMAHWTQSNETNYSYTRRRIINCGQDNDVMPNMEYTTKRRYQQQLNDSRAKNTNLTLQKNIGVNRLTDASNIENTLIRMGTMFSQVASLVGEQAHVVQSIEDDIENALDDSTQAKAQLERLHEISKGNFKIILILIALTLVFLLYYLYMY